MPTVSVVVNVVVALSDARSELSAVVVCGWVFLAQRVGAVTQFEAQQIGDAGILAAVSVVRRSGGAVGEVLEVLLDETSAAAQFTERDG